MSQTLISYQGKKTYYNNTDAGNQFLITKANTIYINWNANILFSGMNNLTNWSFLNYLNFSYVTHGNGMFSNCRYLNNFPDTIDFSNLNNGTYAFANCSNLNQAFSFPNLNNGRSMFSGCTNFNSIVTCGENLICTAGMFSGCTNFNQPFSFGNNVTLVTSMFSGCTNFNQPITLPNNINGDVYGGCTSMFSGCTNFNQPITIPYNVQSCWSMFSNCQNFNQPVTFSNNYNANMNCMYMFNCCKNYNQRITYLPKKVNRFSYMFQSALLPNMSYDFYAYHVPAGTYYVNMFSGKNDTTRINLHARSFGFNNTNYKYSLIGKNITWTTNASNNCQYNTFYNIYLYNDFQET